MKLYHSSPLSRRLAGLTALLALILLAPLDRLAGASGKKKKDPPRRPAVVGFLPDYRTGVIDDLPYDHLTDIVYFSITPKWNGELDLAAFNKDALKKLVKRARRKKVNVLICVGGWNRSQAFAGMASNSVARERFAHELAEFCKKYKLLGADLDWEHPRTSAEVRTYNQLIADVDRKFAEKDLKLTVSVPGWGKMLNAATFSRVDRVHVMAYDHQGPHSTYEHALSDLRFWINEGAPKGKLILGVPLYGRDASRKAESFGDLILREEVPPDVDLIAGFHFNNRATVERKTRLAVEGGFGGVMVWELGQDAPGEKSLLKAIHQTATKLAPR